MKQSEIIAIEKLIIENFHRVLKTLVNEDEKGQQPTNTQQVSNPQEPTGNQASNNQLNQSRAINFNDIKPQLEQFAKKYNLYIYAKSTDYNDLKNLVTQQGGNLPQAGVMAVGTNSETLDYIFIVSKDKNVANQINTDLKTGGYGTIVTPNYGVKDISITTIKPYKLTQQ